MWMSDLTAKCNINIQTVLLVKYIMNDALVRKILGCTSRWYRSMGIADGPASILETCIIRR